MIRIVVVLLLGVVPVFAVQPPAVVVPTRHEEVRVLGTADLRPSSPAVGMVVFQDGRQVAVSTLAGVTVWDLSTGRPLLEADPPAVLRDPDQMLPSVSPKSNGRVCALSSDTALVYLLFGLPFRFDLPLGERPPARLPVLTSRNEGFVGLVAVGAEGTLVGITNTGGVQSLPAAARRWWSFAADVTIGNDPAHTTCIAAGTNVFGVAGGARVRIGRVNPKRSAGVALIGTYDTEVVRAVAVSRDDRRVAAVGWSGKSPSHVVRVWDTANGEAVGRWDVPQGGVDVIALSPDGARMAVANWPRVGHVTVFDAATGENAKSLTAVADQLRFLEYLPDGSGLVAAGVGGVVHHWRLPGGEPAHPARGHVGPVRAVAARSGGGAVTGGADGVVVVYDRDGREERRLDAHPIRIAADRDTGVRALALSPDGSVVYTAGASSSDGTVRAWKLATGEKVAEFAPPGPANSAVALAVAADGRAVAVTLKRGGVRVLDGGTLAVRATAGGDAMSAFGLGFLSGDRVAALDLSNRSVGVWEAATGKEDRRVALPKSPPPVGRRPPAPPIDPWTIGPPATFATSPDGTRFAAAANSSGGMGLTVCTSAGAEVRQLDLGGSRATAVAFTTDATRLAVGGGDGTVRLFDLASGTVRHTYRGHRGAVLSLAASPDGRQLISGGSDTTARVWTLP